jgi:hypothetical protein
LALEPSVHPQWCVLLFSCSAYTSPVAYNLGYKVCMVAYNLGYKVCMTAYSSGLQAFCGAHTSLQYKVRIQTVNTGRAYTPSILQDFYGAHTNRQYEVRIQPLNTRRAYKPSIQGAHTTPQYSASTSLVYTPQYSTSTSFQRVYTTRLYNPFKWFVQPMNTALQHPSYTLQYSASIHGLYPLH